MFSTSTDSSQHRFERLNFVEYTLPGYIQPVISVQYAIDGYIAPFVSALKEQFVTLGDEAFFEEMKMQSLEALNAERRRMN